MARAENAVSDRALENNPLRLVTVSNKCSPSDLDRLADGSRLINPIAFLPLEAAFVCRTMILGKCSLGIYQCLDFGPSFVLSLYSRCRSRSVGAR